MIFKSMLTAAVYAVFLRSLIFSGGLGTTEVVRAAQRNSEIFLSSLLVGVFSAGTGAVCRALLVTLRFGGGQAEPYVLSNLPYAGLAAVYGGVLLVLYLLVCGVLTLAPVKGKRLLLRRMGAGSLNTLVMAVPLLTYRLGENMPSTIGMGLGAGLAFLIVSLLVNSGLHILHKNKAIPSMFSGVPAALIYMGLLALAFMGFTGEILFQ